MDSHVFPILNPPPTSIPIPSSGSSQCTTPEHLSHASNLDWWSVSQLIIYMFQCYSVRSSHPHLLPQSQQICSVYLHLFKTLFSQKKKKILPIYDCSVYIFSTETKSLMIAKMNTLCEFPKLRSFQSVGITLRIFQSWKSNSGRKPKWSDSSGLRLNYLQV